MSSLTSFPLGLLGDPLKYPLRDVLSRICDLIFPGVSGKAHGLGSINHLAFLPVLWAGLHPIHSCLCHQRSLSSSIL